MKLSENIARVLLSADVEVVTHVPGFGATETFEAVRAVGSGAFPVSFHEEPAYTVAHGAALLGTRAASLLKAHGAAKAANSILDSLYAGTTAALLLLVFDDKEGHHSDCIFDVDGFLHGLGIPFRRTDGSDTAGVLKDSIVRSERLGLPVAVVIESELVGNDVAEGEKENISGGTSTYRRDPARHIVAPLFAKYQHALLRRKLDPALRSSTADPVPPPFPRIPDDLPERWQATARSYQPIFEAFRQVRGEFVAGDTGISSLFALPPFNCIDVTTYMGGSVPLAVGASAAGQRDVWAVTGDFSFAAAGHLGLVEALLRNCPINVLLVENGVARATGGQPVDAGILDRLLAGYRDCTYRIEGTANAEEMTAVFRDAASAEGISIIRAVVR